MCSSPGPGTGLRTDRRHLCLTRVCRLFAGCHLPLKAGWLLEELQGIATHLFTAEGSNPLLSAIDSIWPQDTGCSGASGLFSIFECENTGGKKKKKKHWLAGIISLNSTYWNLSSPWPLCAFWASQYQKDVKLLESSQRRAAKMGKVWGQGV